MAENSTEQQEPAGGSAREQRGRPFQKGQSGNPSGRPRRDASPEAAQAVASQAREGRFDGWYSLLTGLGTIMRDKRESMQFAPDLIDWITAENIWRGDDLASRIIETLPNEMIREGFDLCITDDNDGVGPDEAAEVDNPDEKKAKTYEHQPSAEKSVDPELKKKVEHQWEELGLMDALWEALCYERAYGGAAILIGAQDGSTDLEQPLALGNVKSVDFLTVMEPREIQPVLWYGDPRARKFGMPAVYQLTPITPGNTYQTTSGGVGPRQVYAQTVRIHASRLIVFGGIRVSRRLTAVNGGWGDSILTRVWRILRDYNLSWGAAGTLVCDFAQAVYKMKGLNDLLAEDKDDVFKRRMLGMDMARAMTRATMIDSEDDFTRIVTPIAGLPDLLDRFTQRLSMCARLPLPLLAGESPGGINASGASGDQLRMFYDSARSEQKRKVVPHVRRVTQLIMLTLGGEPEQWTIEPRALWQPTQKEQIETRKVQCDIDCAYMDRGVNSQEEIREGRFGGKSYSYETPLIKDDPAEYPSSDDVAAYAAEQKGAKPGAVAAPGGKPGTAAAPVAGGKASAPSAAATPRPGPASPTPSGGELGIQQQVMNGAQIQAMAALIVQVVNKEIPPETAQVMLEIGFQLAPADAARMLAPIKTFEAAKPEPPMPFGGSPPLAGGFGGPPATKIPPKPAE